MSMQVRPKPEPQEQVRSERAIVRLVKIVSARCPRVEVYAPGIH